LSNLRLDDWKPGGNAAYYEQEDETKLLREYDLLLADSLDLTQIGPATTKPKPDLTGNEATANINKKLDLILAKLGIEA
jgi:hypothetical protein